MIGTGDQILASQPPDETTMSSNRKSDSIREVWGTIVSPCTARTVDDGIPSRSSTSEMVSGPSDSTDRTSPSCSTSTSMGLGDPSQTYL